MLVKCICPNCSHSYLADDQMGDLACPRCGLDNDADAGAPVADMPPPPPMGPPMGPGLEPGVYDDPYLDEAFPAAAAPMFEAKAPPPMYVTGERMFKGFVFGIVSTAGLGFVLGGALAAVGVIVPGVAAVLMGLVAGASARYGMGGRTTSATMFRTVATVALVVVVGFAAFFSGGWAVERLTGTRAGQAREDLDNGLRGLVRQRAQVQDTGTGLLLDQRIQEAERLKNLSDPQLEDYLWIQQAQLNQPLLAYSKLRATSGPLVRFGADRDPINVPFPATPGILLAEVILAAVLAIRGVIPKRRY
ncbi:MAG: TFIIB-type zinc ribbon-containing protein [Planctomycetota bacterium]|jgi:hypothetical protein